MQALLRFATLLLHCVLAFFRGRGEQVIVELRRGEAVRRVVSAWDARRRSARSPRSRGNHSAWSRCARGFSGPADWLAERAVQREPVSLEPETGNFAPRSRDSHPERGESVERRTGPTRRDWQSAGAALGAPAESSVPMPPPEGASHGWECAPISGPQFQRRIKKFGSHGAFLYHKS